MRRVLPLCAIFCAAGLLVVGVGLSLNADVPPPPANPGGATTQFSPDGRANPDSKWLETDKGDNKGKGDDKKKSK